MSQQRIDLLIRELVAGNRRASSADVQDIIQWMASAPFDSRTVRVPRSLQGVTYLGYTLTLQEPALLAHLIQRVVVDRQWLPGTTAETYLQDLRRAVVDDTSRLALYLRRGGAIAATLTTTERILPEIRRGDAVLPLMLVVYAADWGAIVSGYQCTSLDTLVLPENAQWLK